MPADRYNIAVAKVIFFDTFIVDKYAVGAIEIFNPAPGLTVDDLCVMATHEFTLDIDFVVQGATDNDSAGTEKVFRQFFARVADHDFRQVRYLRNFRHDLR